MAIDVNGSIRPCCKFMQPNEPGAQVLGNLRDAGVKEIWNGTEFQKLRQQFLNGEKPRSCKNCWDDERAGIRSFRQNIIGDYKIDLNGVDFDSVNAGKPVIFDLKLSQKCNFKCRICGLTASSTFLDEEVKLGVPISKEEKQYLSSCKILTDPAMTAWFKDVAKTVQHLEIFGGEPMLGKENREIEKLLVESGRAHEITLLYNSNASIFLPEVIETWKKFKSVVVCLSIDDIGERFEYQRFPGKWDRVQKILGKYREVRSKGLNFSMFCTVSIFNVYYLTEWLEWYRENYPEFSFYFNILHTPEYFSIHSLSDEMKDKVAEKTMRRSRELGFTSEMMSKLDEVLRFMVCTKTEADPTEHRVREILRRDEFRKQDYRKVFPEVSAYF